MKRSRKMKTRRGSLRGSKRNLNRLVGERL